MNGGVSFIGFSPAEKAKGMETLEKVIMLKDKNRETAEESAGWTVQDQEKYTRRFQPIVNAIERASGAILRYNGQRDISEASKQLIEADAWVRKIKQAIKRNPGDQGLISLGLAYSYQALYARAKLNYLTLAKNLENATTEDKQAEALSDLEKARDEYAEMLAKFEEINIPVGFKQVVDILRPPAKGEIYPGASLQIPSDTPTVSTPMPRFQPGNLPSVLGTIALTKANIPSPGLRFVPKTVSPPIEQQVVEPELQAPPAPAPAPAPAKSQLEQWVDDLLKLREGNPVPPELNEVPVPTKMHLILLPRGGGDHLLFSLTNALGSKSATVRLKLSKVNNKPVLEIVKAGGSPTQVPFEEPHYYMMTKGNIPDDISPVDLSKIIEANILAFGGWGEEFWSRGAPEKIIVSLESDALQQIVFNDAYPQAIEIAKTTFSNQPNKDDVGKGIKKTVRSKAKRLVMTPDGKFGDLNIDVQELFNNNHLIAHKGGKKVMDVKAPAKLKQLVSKRVLQKTIDGAPEDVRKAYDKLLKLAGHASSASPAPPMGGRKMAKPKAGAKPKANTKPPGESSGVIVVGNLGDVVERLKVATGVYNAGNRSKKNVQLISELASALRREEAISPSEFKKIMLTYT